MAHRLLQGKRFYTALVQDLLKTRGGHRQKEGRNKTKRQNDLELCGKTGEELAKYKLGCFLAVEILSTVNHAKSK